MRILSFVLHLFQIQGTWKNGNDYIVIKNKSINIKNNNHIIDTSKTIVNKNNLLEIKWNNSKRTSQFYLFDKENLLVIHDKNNMKLFTKENIFDHIKFLYILNISTLIFTIFFFNEYLNLINSIFMNIRRI